MAKKSALIIVKLDPPKKKEAEWNKWYNSKHIPDRIALPGFQSARRFTKVGGAPEGFMTDEPKYLTLYDLSDTDTLKTELYLELKKKEALQPTDSFEAITLRLPRFARGVYEQIYPLQGEYRPPQTKFVFIVGHEVPQNKQREFNAWYDTEHIPAMLSRVPGFVTARRFLLAKDEFQRNLDSAFPKYLTIYDVESESLFASEVFMRETVSPWSTWVRTWITRKMRAICFRIYPKE
jgi:hypothetical protein